MAQYMSTRCSVKLTDILFITVIFFAHYVQSYHLQRHNSGADETNRPKVRLIENPFHFIIQNSIPTSLPHTAKSNSVVKYKHQPNYVLPAGAPEEEAVYQADEGSLPWYLPPHEESELTESEETAAEEWDCKLSCPNGFRTDVEGKELCKCFDPCEGVKCFGGSTCEVKRECIFDICSFKALCKAPEDVCSLPKPRYTFMCEKLSKRYYYDSKKGRCRKFWGCAELEGNSFDSKKECKRECYSKDQKLRNREERINRKSSKDSGSSVLESHQQPDMSNHIPVITSETENHRYPDQSAMERIEETHNRIDTDHHKKAFAALFNRELPGLNQVTGCPADRPYEPCPFNPCAGCSNKNIMCFTSFCGKCQAIYIDMRTGEASDKFAAAC